MTALTLRVIWKNLSVTLNEICKNFSKISRTPPTMANSTLSQNLQEAAVTICSEKFGCPSQESLPKFKEHLFLMTAFKAYHMCREHEDCPSKIGGVEEASVNVWGSMGGGIPLKKENI